MVTLFKQRGIGEEGGIVAKESDQKTNFILSLSSPNKKAGKNLNQKRKLNHYLSGSSNKKTVPLFSYLSLTYKCVARGRARKQVQRAATKSHVASAIRVLELYSRHISRA
ncbi:hypothetical protein M9H77_30667 [Catharanthus roseus]|uniref:Uncharacterized protein n=1 Tax=Catharanthus roseus TaxID=4058 RepID=A0ACB9ZZQ6_CATRO|nr:hypothetical protein M9H77_30667 [Catharanthus roseus]